MDNKDIAGVLKEIALYKELKGENVFKVRAFEQAARTIESHMKQIKTLFAQNELSTIKGVGKSIALVIKELIQEGISSELEDLRKAIPEGLMKILSIEGMGPKKAKLVWQKLEITTVGELEYACKENRLSTLEGFGQKSQEKILKSIEFKKIHRGQHLFSEAWLIAEQIKEQLEQNKLFDIVTIAGSLRRGKEVVKDADIIVIPRNTINIDKIINLLTSLVSSTEASGELISAGKTKVSIRKAGLQIDFRIIQKPSYACALQHFTGSKEHNTLLRSRAKTLDYKMNEYGLFKGDNAFYPDDEQEVYKFLNLPWIPPELREAAGEIEAADLGKLPPLLKRSQIKGMIHVHSNYSDGLYSIEELALECQKRSYSYLCLSDHSRSAYYAHGLSIERLNTQLAEIKTLNKKLAPFHIFSGIESDILADGSLDYPDDVLQKLDFVIGAIHSNFNMTQEKATERLIRAVKNPYLTILAHPSGRLLLSRKGYSYLEEEILTAMVSHNVVMEHNCNPHRLDPGWQVLKKAAQKRILISINCDAHDIEGFEHMALGNIMARKAWLGPEQILNSKSIEEIDEFFRERKKRTHP